MRIIALVAAAAGFVLAPGLGAQGMQKVMLTHLASPTVSIRLTAAVGDVHVVGWDKDSVELSGVVPAGVKVDMFGGDPTERSKGMKAYADAPPDQSGREGRLTLRVPREATVWVKTGTAEVDVTGVTGSVDLNVVGGSITVHGSPRDVRAESMDGNVTIDGSPPWLRAKTAAGDISLQGGGDVGASTISGTVRASGGIIEHARLEATTGGIYLASSFAKGASVELETHSGPIDVVLFMKTSVEIDAASITGAIDNQWTYAKPLVGREGRGMTLVTSLGTGGAHIQIRTFKGTIQLKTK